MSKPAFKLENVSPTEILSDFPMHLQGAEPTSRPTVNIFSIKRK